jgi:hypothetical protein
MGTVTSLHEVLDAYGGWLRGTVLAENGFDFGEQDGLAECDCTE